MLKLERIPMELLLLLVEQRDSIVTREQNLQAVSYEFALVVVQHRKLR